MMMNEKKKMSGIEVLRFTLTLIIVFYHLFRSQVLPVPEGHAVVESMKFFTNNASLAVDCFLVIAGFFLCTSLERNENASFTELLLKRIIRLWPVLLFSSVCEMLLWRISIYKTIIKLLFLQSIGLTKDASGISWYISCYFWAVVFYTALFKVEKNSGRRLFLTGIIIYIGYILNINNTSGGFGRGVIFQAIDIGLLRALGGIGTGILANKCAVFAEKSLEALDFRHYWLFRVGRIMFFLSVCLYLLYKPFGYTETHLINIIFTCLYLQCCFCDHSSGGLFDVVLDKTALFGRYSYSIYLMQQTVFYLIRRVLITATFFQNMNLFVIIILELLLCVITGTVTYYICERPCAEKGMQLLGQLKERGVL